VEAYALIKAATIAQERGEYDEAGGYASDGWTLAYDLHRAGGECDDPDGLMHCVGRGVNILADLIERLGEEDIHDQAFMMAT
jgi:hypothetical protein